MTSLIDGMGGFHYPTQVGILTRRQNGRDTE
jgi:hypothetical protein